MKKIISIFLLSIMLVVGTRPVLAVHFCAGELHSFAILDGEVDCCKELEEREMNSDVDLSLEDGKATSGVDKQTASSSHEGCCNTQKLLLSTDDYQHQQVQQFNLGNILPSFEIIWMALHPLVSAESEGDSKTVQYISLPLGGLSLENVDLLDYLCIYRI